MSLADIERADRRVLILLALADDPDYSVLHHVLCGVLADDYNYSVAATRRDIAWLEEHGLVTTQAAAASMPEATITMLGVDVARGRSRFAGVANPRRGL